MYISSSLARAIKDKWIHPVTEEPRGSFRNTLTGEPAVYPNPNKRGYP